jgi:hypothetical protein
MQLRSRVSRAILLLALATFVATVAVWWHERQTAGAAEVQAVTVRMADAVERGDVAALTAEPHLDGHSYTVNWLLSHRAALGSGYRVEVQRNGDGGYQLLSLDLVTHIVLVRAAGGELRLGFRYDRASGRLEFVTASSSTLSVAR